MNKPTLVLLCALLLVGCKTTSSAESAPATTSSTSTSGAALSSTAAAAPDANIEAGRKLTAMFYAGDTAGVWAKMNPEMQTALKSEADFAAFRQQMQSQLGTETQVLDERVTPRPPYQVYQRKASFSGYPNPINVTWTLDPSGTVAGFFVKPAK